MRLRLFAIAALCAALPLCGSAVDREITESWNIARTPRTLQDIYFLQAESVQLDLTVNLGTEPYPLTNTNTVVVWEISQGEAYTNLMAAATGTVINATGGVVRLTLTPEQSNLTNGTYNGYVIAAVSDGTNLTDRLVLARQNIEIGWSPYGLEFEYVGLTPVYYLRTTIDAMTNSLALDITATSNAFISADTVVSNGLVSAYTAADTVVSNALASAYTAADTVVSNGLASAYTAADTVVSNGLASAYTAADTVVSNALQTAISSNTNRLASLESKTNNWNSAYTSVSAGINTNFTFMSDGSTTGQLWFASGILTNITLDVSE